MISAENITKSYGNQLLFDDISFKLNPRERLGLVGRNGHGKTTLFQLISGKETPDSGTITAPKNYRIAQVRQQLDFSENSILEECAGGLPEHERTHLWKVEKILEGLGFSGKDMHRPPEEFSGGYQVRLNLVKALVSEPDLLLLDEPTNYLDITSIRWIERFLLDWSRELILITHDRSFMDRIVTHTMGIHRCKIRKIVGDTGKYYTQLAQEEEIHEKTRINDERRRKEVEQFISRFRAKARLANLVQSRIKTLEKTEKREKLQKLHTLEFSFRSCPFPGKFMLQVQDLAFDYHEPPSLIRDFNFTLNAGDRVCVVGKNGRGKTTLLKLLAGTLTPCSGSVRYSPNTVIGAYEQTNVSSLVDSRSVEEEILQTAPDINYQAARNICGAMMFEGDDALKKISVLSGGEKSRVMLGKLLATPVNLLLLDEPSNHLDMESCDSLLAALDNFEGAVIMVTHNEMFLHTLAERLIVFQDGRLELFEGSYQRFLERGGWQVRTEPASANPNEDRSAGNRAKPTKKGIRRQRSEVITKRAKELNPIQREISDLEDRIDHIEKKLARLNDDMQVATRTGKGPKIAEISQAMHSGQEEIARLFEKLEKLSHEHDRKKQAFDQELAELEEGLKNA